MEDKYFLMINLEENLKKIYVKTFKEKGYEIIEKDSIIIAKKLEKRYPDEEDITDKMIFRYSMPYKKEYRAYIDISKEAIDSINYLRKNGIESIKFHNTPGYFIKNAITREILNKK